MYRKLRNDELGRLSTQEFKQTNKLSITIVLDNVRSQHNIGSAFRTADSFLIEKIILCGISATPPTAEIHKSALGAEFSVDWEYCKETLQAVNKLKQDGYTIVSIEQAENSISLEKIDTAMISTGTTDLQAGTKFLSGDKKYALIFGNEVKGVQQEVVNASHGVIEIPQLGTKHSLNISVSVGIILWEFCKHLFYIAK